MALIKPAGSSRDFCYAVVRNISGDKGSNRTSVNVALYFDAADRAANIEPGETLPETLRARTFTIEGYDLSLADIYTTIADHPYFEGWVSDEQVPA